MKTNKEQIQPSHAGCLTRSQWLNNKSRVKGDLYARFCENLGLKCPVLLDKYSMFNDLKICKLYDFFG